MLRSWIKNISLDEIYTRRTLRLSFGSLSIHASLTTQFRQKHTIEWQETAHLQRPFFRNTPDSFHRDILDSFFEKVNGQIQDKFVQVEVFLPDPISLYGFYQLDSVPDNARQCRQLAGWRLGKQFHIHSNEWLCDYQILGEVQQKHLMMAVGVDVAWLTLIQDGLYENGILTTLVDTRINHAFNQMAASVTQKAAAAIMVSTDYWTVMAWDDQARPRLVRSRWRNIILQEAETDLVEVVQEIIETLLIYGNQGTDTQINEIYILGTGQVEQALAAVLNQHMTKPIQHIELTLNHDDMGEESGSGQVQNQSNAAAVSR